MKTKFAYPKSGYSGIPCLRHEAKGFGVKRQYLGDVNAYWNTVCCAISDDGQVSVRVLFGCSARRPRAEGRKDGIPGPTGGVARTMTETFRFPKECPRRCRAASPRIEGSG